MKIRSFIFAAAAISVLASCSNSVSEVTEITGKFGETVPEEVTVIVGEIDTTLVVENGTFSVSVPTNKCLSGMVVLDRSNRAAFIPDGTKLVADFSQSPAVVVSQSKNSLTAKLNEAEGYLRSFYADNNAKLQELKKAGASDAEMETFIDSVNVEFNAYFKQILEENKDNNLSLYALTNISDSFEPAELIATIDGLSEEMKENKNVKRMRTAADAQAKTAEGQMFTDFTIEQSVVGMTRSIPPQPVYGAVKLSDYVGKGKYVLVDFWASWCGPCKREMPNLKNVYETYKGDKFEMVSIAVWDQTEASLKVAEEVGIVWPHIVNAGSVPTDLYGIQGIPHIILFGPDGTILKRGLRGEAIGEEIAKYVK